MSKPKPKPSTRGGSGPSFKPVKSSEQGFGIRTGDTFTRLADWKRISVKKKSR
jgi:hypothetical protein